MYQKSKLLKHINGVYIHIVETVIDQNFPTLLYLPGLSGEAVEGFQNLSPLLKNRINIASMSFRGRGSSSTPISGYGLEDHAMDLDLAIKDLESNKLILIATSISTLYAANYINLFGKNHIKGIVIVDHPLRSNKLNPGWAEDLSKLKIEGTPITSTMRKSALYGIERESTEIDFYSKFGEISTPTLLLYPTVPRGLILDSDISLYRRMDHVSLVEFKNSDHFIRLRQREKYLAELSKFVKSLDNMH